MTESKHLPQETAMTESKRVSVIGLGLMGSAIARSLIRSGYEVTVWNRTHSKSESVAGDGATATRDLAEAISASPVSFWCLLDCQMVTELMDEPAVRSALAGKTVVNSVTGGPDDVARVAESAAKGNASFIDAKINFFPAQAGDEDAEMLSSGDNAAFLANEKLLRNIAGDCRFLSNEVTAASVLCAAVWTVDFAERCAYMEAAALVTAYGLSLEDFRLSASLRTAQFEKQNQALSDRFARGDFDGDQATVDIYADGVNPMLGAYRKVGLDAHMLEATGRYSKEAQRAGFGLKDISVIYHLLTREEGQ
ncbi:NAD(P)-dependent oxidoreductase [Salinibacterium sp. ZJ450]|uniref:NAD(P)-dependent oxidoreductase n=1 Tax=Salinibacterium sp. ZJ450 TaxID=2708338 RepID=UPI00141D7B43|nr:NAD(P)-binding domain-containing protein [Salinibacterium sp. ZJ450]